MAQVLSILCRFCLRSTLVFFLLTIISTGLQQPSVFSAAYAADTANTSEFSYRTVATKSGVINTDETWSGEVLVTGDVVVASGVTLTILPGSTIRFLPGVDDQASGDYPSLAEIRVIGVLVAVGTAQQPIQFTSFAATPIPGDWGRIWIESTMADSQIGFADVSYATVGIRAVSGRLRVHDSHLRDNREAGIILGGSGAAQIENNQISNNWGSGIQVTYYASPLVLGNVITNNGGDGIWLKESWQIIPVFHNNLITNNGRYALNNQTNSDVDATNNDWGTSEPLALSNLIYDFNDTAESGLVAIASPSIQAERHITGLEIWSESQTVTQHIWLDAGAYLLIRAGTDVRFTGAYGIFVRQTATFIVDGAETSPVTFLPENLTPHPGDWGTIKFFVTGTQGRITHADIGYATRGIILHSSSPHLESFVIHNSLDTGLHASNRSNPLLHFCTITDNGMDGMWLNASGPVITQCH